MPNERRFLKWQSVISYSYARIRIVEDIEVSLSCGKAKQREPVSPELLKRIRMGLKDSDFTPNGVRYYFASLSEDE